MKTRGNKVKMKTELKVYVSEKWRFYPTVCLFVSLSVCVCV